VTDAPGPVSAAVSAAATAAESDGVSDAGALAYDDAFAELQRVVAALETGGVSLEATIAQYERAVALERRCERLLAEAELRVQQLMTRPDGSLDRVDVRPDEAVE
jgi:exodeoxyribonuclease VII small subunit